MANLSEEAKRVALQRLADAKEARNKETNVQSKPAPPRQAESSRHLSPTGTVGTMQTQQSPENLRKHQAILKRNLEEKERKENRRGPGGLSREFNHTR